MESDPLTARIIGAAIEVHRELGPGLLEAPYETCLCHELARCGLQFARQLSLPIRYKDIDVDNAYRLDVVVEGKVAIEVKSAEALTTVHVTQLMTYLRLGKLSTGLLLNFNVKMMRDGIKRIVL